MDGYREEMRVKGKKKRKVKKLVTVLLAISVALLIYDKTALSKYKETDFILNLLDLGNKYPEVMDYESAIAFFESVLHIDPQEAETYLDKMEAGLPSEELMEVLGDLPLYDDAEQYDRLKELLDQVMELLPEEFQTELKKQLGGWMEENGQ